MSKLLNGRSLERSSPDSPRLKCPPPPTRSRGPMRVCAFVSAGTGLCPPQTLNPPPTPDPPRHRALKETGLGKKLEPTQPQHWFWQQRIELGTEIDPCSFTHSRTYEQFLHEAGNEKNLRTYNCFLLLFERKRQIKKRKMNKLVSVAVPHVKPRVCIFISCRKFPALLTVSKRASFSHIHTSEHVNAVH